MVSAMLSLHDEAVVLCPAAADLAAVFIAEALHREKVLQHIFTELVYDLPRLCLECGAVQFFCAVGMPCMPELVAAFAKVHSNMADGLWPLVLIGELGIK